MCYCIFDVYMHHEMQQAETLIRMYEKKVLLYNCDLVMEKVWLSYKEFLAYCILWYLTHLWGRHMGLYELSGFSSIRVIDMGTSISALFCFCFFFPCNIWVLLFIPTIVTCPLILLLFLMNRESLLLISDCKCFFWLGKISSWIDLDSYDETLCLDSETTLKQEIAWASHLSLQVRCWQKNFYLLGILHHKKELSSKDLHDEG